MPIIARVFKLHKEIENMKITPLKAIRQNCRKCSGDNSPRECTSKTCPLYSWRFGKKPEGANISSKARTPLKVIREYCVYCSHGELKRIKDCDIPDCPLSPFRFGKNPFLNRGGVSDKEKERLRALAEKGRECQKRLVKPGG